MGEQPQPSERTLTLQPRRDVSRKSDKLKRCPEHKLPRVQNKRFIGADLDQSSQVGLLLGRINKGILVVVEQAKCSVEPDIHRRRLDHRPIVGLSADPLLVEFGANVAVREKHVARLAMVDRMARSRLSWSRCCADVVQWQNFSDTIPLRYIFWSKSPRPCNRRDLAVFPTPLETTDGIAIPQFSTGKPRYGP